MLVISSFNAPLSVHGPPSVMRYICPGLCRRVSKTGGRADLLPDNSRWEVSGRARKVLSLGPSNARLLPVVSGSALNTVHRAANEQHYSTSLN